MDWAIGNYKEIIGEREFELRRQDEDRGLGFFLGLEKGVPERVTKISKEYIYRVWGIREKEREKWKQELSRREIFDIGVNVD